MAKFILIPRYGRVKKWKNGSKLSVRNRVVFNDVDGPSSSSLRGGEGRPPGGGGERLAADGGGRKVINRHARVYNTGMECLWWHARGCMSVFWEIIFRI